MTTKFEYTIKARGYYERRISKLLPSRPGALVANEAIGYFRVVQAGIMSIAPGRQSSKTRGWNDAALQAHRRAAAALR